MKLSRYIAAGVIFEPQFESTTHISDNYAHVCADGLFGFIDIQGNILIEPKYEAVSYCSDEGVAAVQKDGEWFIIDMEGNTVY